MGICSDSGKTGSAQVPGPGGRYIPHALRTSFYGVLSHIGNGAATSYTTTAANGLGPITSNGKDVSSLQVGVRHAF